LKTIGEVVTTLKIMFEETSGGRYTQALNDDIAKLLPKLKQDYTSVETIVTKPQPGNDNEACILALATRLEKNFDQYNELCDWHAKIGPTKKKAKKV